jgi:dolichol-phosphate mannosyltransferase
MPYSVLHPTSPGRLHGDTLVSIVVPCFNEEAVLPLLFERLRSVLASWDCRYEVLFVDDGSTDRTWDLLCDALAVNQGWKAVRLSRNFGHQLALWTGLQQCHGDVVAVLDADLQDPPELLDEFLSRWSDGYDVIFAVRRKRKEGLFKRLAYHVFYRLLGWLAEVDIPLDAGDFAVIDRRVLNAMTSCREQEPFVRGLRAWVGFRQVGIPYDRPARAAGEVKYTFRKLTRLALSGIYNFSTRPLRLATWSGLGTVTLGILGALYLMALAITGAPIDGTFSILTALLFLGGIQLVCVGILGEYIGRIYLETKGRPLTIISEHRGETKDAHVWRRVA